MSMHMYEIFRNSDMEVVAVIYGEWPKVKRYMKRKCGVTSRKVNPHKYLDVIYSKTNIKEFVK